jgi:hypothetical protein
MHGLVFEDREHRLGAVEQRMTRLLDVRETTAEKQWTRTNPGKPFKGLYGSREQKLRWQNFSKCGGEEMLKVVRRLVDESVKPLIDSELKNVSAAR